MPFGERSRSLQQADSRMLGFVTLTLPALQDWGFRGMGQRWALSLLSAVHPVGWVVEGWVVLVLVLVMVEEKVMVVEVVVVVVAMMMMMIMMTMVMMRMMMMMTVMRMRMMTMIVMVRMMMAIKSSRFPTFDLRRRKNRAAVAVSATELKQGW